MSTALAEKRETDRHFIEQLLDTKKLDNYTVPVSIRADLRKYQQVQTYTKKWGKSLSVKQCCPSFLLVCERERKKKANDFMSSTKFEYPLPIQFILFQEV